MYEFVKQNERKRKKFHNSIGVSTSIYLLDKKSLKNIWLPTRWTRTILVLGACSPGCAAGATIQKGRRGLFVELWSFESVLFARGVWYVGLNSIGVSIEKDFLFFSWGFYMFLFFYLASPTRFELVSAP